MSADAVRSVSPAGATPAPRRPGLRVLPGGRVRPPRAPFVVLVLLVLGVGLVGLLILNTGLQQSSFDLRDLERETRSLRDQHAALTQQVTRLSAPAELAAKAESLGMVPAGEREYLVLNGDGAGDDDEGAGEGSE